MRCRTEFWRKFFLATASVVAMAGPVVFGLANAPRVRAQSQPTSDALIGAWQGTLPRDSPLRIVIKVSRANDQSFTAVMYSIDEQVPPFPIGSTTLNGSTVKMLVPGNGGEYDGTLSADGNSIKGTWMRPPMPNLPLNLTRATTETAWAIPEPPAPLKPMAADADPAFEVATIKPNNSGAPGKGFRVAPGRRFSTINTSLSDLISFAYGLHARQITGGPDWTEKEKYDLAAQPDGEGQPSDKQWKMMVQKLLAGRFQLKFHLDKKQLTAYEIVVGKTGPKLTKSVGDPNGLPGLGFRGPGAFMARNATMADFAEVMQSIALDRPVVDQTGISGRYDFTLNWTPDETQFGGRGAVVPPAADNVEAPPDLFTAIQEQLGLKLQSSKAPVDVLVIDHVEKPSPN